MEILNIQQIGRKLVGSIIKSIAKIDNDVKNISCTISNGQYTCCWGYNERS